MPGHGNRYLSVYILIYRYAGAVPLQCWSGNKLDRQYYLYNEHMRSPILSVPRTHAIANIICARTICDRTTSSPPSPDPIGGAQQYRPHGLCVPSYYHILSSSGRMFPKHSSFFGKYALLHIRDLDTQMKGSYN